MSGVQLSIRQQLANIMSMTPENSPQRKLDFDDTVPDPEADQTLRLEEARSKYKELVGISPHIDKMNDVEALEQAVSSAESVASERERIRLIEHDDDQRLAWWKR